MRRLLCVVGALLSVAAFAVAPALAQKPVALVIGNAAYPSEQARLKYPIADARALAEELRQLQFDVDLKENVSQGQMRAAMRDFYEKITQGAPALLYFGGIGIQDDRRENFLTSVDAQIWTMPDVQRAGFSIDAILGEMSSRKPSLTIAILDASRGNSFETRFRKAPAGLAAIGIRRNTLIMSSAAPGELVRERGGGNSVFMATLLNEFKDIRASGGTVQEAFKRTTTKVLRATNGEQLPSIFEILPENLVIAPTDAPTMASATSAAPSPVTPAAAPVTPAPVPTPPPPDELRWAELQGTTDIAALRTFIGQFPDSIHRTEAERRIKELEDRASARAVLAATPADNASANLAPGVARTPLPAAPQTCTTVMAGSQPAYQSVGGEFRPVSIKPDLTGVKPVRTVAISPDGKKIATAGDDNIIRLWDAASLRLLTTLSGHTAPVYSIDFRPDTPLLASASWDGTIRLWNLTTGRADQIFLARSDTRSKPVKLFSLAIYPGKPLRYIDAVGEDGSVWIWDVPSGKRLSKDGHKAREIPILRSLSFAPNDSGEFAIAGFDGTVTFYLPSGRTETVAAHTGKVLRVAYSPDGRRIISAGSDDGLRNLKVWNVADHRLLRVLAGHNSYVVGAAWSQDGRLLASGGGGIDRTVRLWDVERGRQLHVYAGHTGDVEAVVFHPNRNRLISVGEDGSMKVWDVDSERELLTAVAFGGADYVAYTPSGCFVGSNNIERRLKVVSGAVESAMTGEQKRIMFAAEGFAGLVNGN